MAVCSRIKFTGIAGGRRVHLLLGLKLMFDGFIQGSSWRAEQNGQKMLNFKDSSFFSNLLKNDNSIPSRASREDSVRRIVSPLRSGTAQLIPGSRQFSEEFAG